MLTNEKYTDIVCEEWYVFMEKAVVAMQNKDGIELDKQCKHLSREINALIKVYNMENKK